MKNPVSATLDSTDRELIALLRENARTPTALLARRLGLSRTTVQSRIDRLERTGVITGYSVKVSETQERNAVNAYIMITVGPKSAARVDAEIRKMSAVRVLESVSGAFDLIAIAVTPTVAEMNALIDAIGVMEGVERTTSAIVLSNRFSR